jgi:peroxiredoxin
MSTPQQTLQQTPPQTPQQSLQQQLAEFQAAFKQRAPAERVAMMEAATAQLRATGIESSALGVGAALPDIDLHDAQGRVRSLKAQNADGPLVIVFYRGGWCPYCNLALREWQRLLPDLRRLGASLVAVSPQTPDNSLSTAEKNALAFPVFSDSQLVAAVAFGLAFTLAPELVDLYRSAGNDLPRLNGNGEWALPLPATYLIDRHGVVAYAHVETDYRLRAEPQDVLDRLRQMA